MLDFISYVIAPVQVLLFISYAVLRGNVRIGIALMAINLLLAVCAAVVHLSLLCGYNVFLTVIWGVIVYDDWKNSGGGKRLRKKLKNASEKMRVIARKMRDSSSAPAPALIPQPGNAT